ADPFTVAERHPSRNTHHDGIRGHLAHDYGAGADPAAAADGKAADDLGAGPDDDVVAERGVALLALQAGAAERDALEQRDVFADRGRRADDDAHAVIDEQSRPESGGRMDLDARREAVDMGYPAGQCRPPGRPDGVAHAVDPDRVHAGITEDDLERGARRRVP